MGEEEEQVSLAAVGITWQHLTRCTELRKVSVWLSKEADRGFIQVPFLSSWAEIQLQWNFCVKMTPSTFQLRQAKYCQLMDKLLEASTQYLHNCCLIIFMTRGAGSFCRIEDDIFWQ